MRKKIVAESIPFHVIYFVSHEKSHFINENLFLQKLPDMPGLPYYIIIQRIFVISTINKSTIPKRLKN